MLGVVACADQRGRGERTEVPASNVVAGPESTFHAQLGRTWELTRLGDRDIASFRAGPGMSRGRPTLRFTSDPSEMAGEPGRLQAGGRSFCNDYGTAYRLGPGDELSFRFFQSTLVGCDGPDSLETRFFRGLANTRRFEIDASTLDLIAADGSRLTFVPAADSIRPR